MFQDGSNEEAAPKPDRPPSRGGGHLTAGPDPPRHSQAVHGCENERRRTGPTSPSPRGRYRRREPSHRPEEHGRDERSLENLAHARAATSSRLNNRGWSGRRGGRRTEEMRYGPATIARRPGLSRRRRSENPTGRTHKSKLNPPDAPLSKWHSSVYFSAVSRNVEPSLQSSFQRSLTVLVVYRSRA